MTVPALLTLFLSLASLWTAAPAWAHPYLVQSDPGYGVALREPPSRIQIGFTERVVLEGSSLRLDDSENRPMALGPLGTPKEGPGLAADIKPTLGGDVVADALAPPAEGERIFRLAGDPYAEGWAAGRTVAHSGVVGRTDVPHRMSVVIEADDPGGERIVAGLHDALALDPALAVQVEGERPLSTADVEVVVRRHEPGTPLFPVVQEAVNGSRYTASFLAAEPAALAAALDSLSDTEIGATAALLVASRSFDETFVRSSRVGRRGDVKIYGEVAPDSGDSLLYTRLVSTIFPGEEPTVDGLRGFMAGKAVVAGLEKGASIDSLVEHLEVLALFSDGVVSGWSPATPAAGSWRFLLFKGSFLPGGLVPGRSPEPGRYFPEGGAWSRVATGNVGLCSPQRSVDGPPPPCEPLPEE